MIQIFLVGVARTVKIIKEINSNKVTERVRSGTVLLPYNILLTWRGCSETTRVIAQQWQDL